MQHSLHLSWNNMTSKKSSFSEGYGGWSEFQLADAADTGYFSSHGRKGNPCPGSRLRKRAQVNIWASTQNIMKRHLNFRAGKRLKPDKMLRMTSLSQTTEMRFANLAYQYRNATYYCHPFIGTHNMVAFGFYWNLPTLPEGRVEAITWGLFPALIIWAGTWKDDA